MKVFNVQFRPSTHFKERLSGITGWYLTEKNSYSFQMDEFACRNLQIAETGRRRTSNESGQGVRLSASHKGLQTPDCTKIRNHTVHHKQYMKTAYQLSYRIETFQGLHFLNNSNKTFNESGFFEMNMKYIWSPPCNIEHDLVHFAPFEDLWKSLLRFVCGFD